ncbi:MAG TPA: hypothetical protein VFK32_09895 [Tepidiformaceae bacterium]|nr:hypothetical protein [Tepidiformaceae bacterium]
MSGSSESSRNWAPWVVLGPVLLLLILFAIVLTIFRGGIDDWSPSGDVNLSAGDPWDGTSGSGFPIREAETFDDFPLAWFGPEVLGYRLQRVERQGESVQFSYGDCRQGNDPCDAPIRLHISPVCSIPPSAVFAPEVFAALAPGPATAVQGESVLVYTADSLIRIAGLASLEVRTAAIDRLLGYGAGADTLGATVADFPSPDFTACPFAP